MGCQGCVCTSADCHVVHLHRVDSAVTYTYETCTIHLTSSNQVTAVASAGVAFTYIGEVPPITLASWRLQLTAVITAAAGAVQWCTSMSPENRARFRADMGLAMISGLALTLHFATWVWSLQVGGQ